MRSYLLQYVRTNQDGLLLSITEFFFQTKEFPRTAVYARGSTCAVLVGQLLLDDLFNDDDDIYIYIYIYIRNGFGGLGVACWPLVPKFAGSNPAEAVGFFRAKKFSARLPSEGKLNRRSHVVDLRHVKGP